MGGVAIFQWEMLFPDRLDFLVLLPLPVKTWQLLSSKAMALLGFLWLFLLSCNVFGALVLPAVTSEDFFRQVFAHTLAVTLAGTFAASFLLAFIGILLCVLNTAVFRLISPFVQMFSVVLLILCFFYYGRVGDALPLILSTPIGLARWFPPLWFLGVYEDLLHGASGPCFAHPMAQYGYRATGLALAIVMLTYPTAWVRIRKLAIEGISSGLDEQAWWLRGLIQVASRRPVEIAMLTFICQTLTRTNRYQVYLAMYGGVGLSLATVCAVDFYSNGSRLLPIISAMGLHATLPLLLFWMIAGLRIAFALPLNLSAGWIFRITGVSVTECANAARRFVFLGACVMLISVLSLLFAYGWGLKQLLVQTVVGLCICTMLTDGFFLGPPSVPFNKARMPGKTNLPLLLALYLGFFPLYVYGVVGLENYLEKHLVNLLLVVGITVGFNRLAQRIASTPEEIEEEMEGYEGDFQLLRLS